MKLLTRQEEIVLLSSWKLKENADGVAIRELISEITGKHWPIGSIYSPLEKLVARGYVRAFYGEITAKRGGRAKRYYEILPSGMAALSEMKSLTEAFWEGIPETAENRTGV